MLKQLRYLGSRLRGKGSKNIKTRKQQFEQLERRDLLAAAIWHNPVFPLDVTGDQPARVNALDALRVINWLNNPSQPRELPRQVDYSTHGFYVDTTCDGRVNALDALRVINHLNGVGAGEVGGFFTDGGSFASAACSPQLLEGSSFATELERVLKIPAGRPALEVKFQAPEFDLDARQQIRDAFEVQIVMADGSPVSNRLSSSRSAALNWTEGFQPVAASGVWMDIAGAGQDSKITFDLSEFPVGTEIRVLARLVNNDRDNNTSVIIRGYEFVELPSSQPNGGAEGLTGTGPSAVSEFDIRQLSDLSGMFEIDYGRTSLSSDRVQLVSQARLKNISGSAVIGPIVAVFENFSNPNVFMIRPDGILPDGRPFIDLTNRMSGPVLSSGQSITGPEIRFRNNSGQRFDYRLSIYGTVNMGPAGFISQPVTSIEAGKRYGYEAKAKPTNDMPLTYSLVTGPEAMRVNGQSGQVEWLTQASDVGSHRITLRATDRFGLFVEQSFELQVTEQLPNRPPVFISTPATEAVAAGAFDVITLPTGSLPTGLAVGNFGILDGARSINQLSVVAINQGSQTLSLIPGLGRDGAGKELYGATGTLSVGEPPLGNGLFRSALDVDVGLPAIASPSYDLNRIMGLAVGDFNADGNLDTATSIVYQFRTFSGADGYERRIAINLGNGDGTFSSPNHLPVPGPVVFASDSLGAISLRAHDFDRDGRLDLLVSETKGKKLLFYKGIGDGTFAPATEQTTGTDIAGYKVADLDGNGRLDLVAIRADGRAFGVLLGNGDGSFQPYAEFSTHTGDTVNHNFALGDLNGDGIVDFVSGNHSTRMLNLYLGNGNGTFSRGVDLFTRGVFSTNPTVGDWSMAVVIGDFSGNGHADIAYTTYTNNGFGTGFGGGIALYEGDGSGTEFTWSTAVTIAMSQAPQNIHGDAQPVDLNGDGHLDLVFTGPGEWGNFAPGVNVAINDGTGKFTSTFWIDSNMGSHPQPGNLNNGLGVLTGDFNNDGMLDLLTARNGRSHVGRQFSSVSLMLADSPGSYRAAYDVRASSAMWGTVTFVEYADFNNDGILDLWGPAYQNPSFTQLGKGDGTFQQPITATPWIGNEALGKGFAADLDRDGNMDVVWYGGGGVQGGPQGRYLAALGNGDGTFRITFAQTGNNTPSGYAPVVIKPADFNRDGYMDFVSITGLNTIEIMRNVPETPGTFTRSYSIPFGAATLHPSLTAGDFDGDGLADVIAVRGQPTNVHDLLFYKGIGDGTLAQPVLFPFAPDIADFRFPKHIATGDLNGDGHLDFVINASYNRSAAVLGNGDGTFRPPMVYQTGTIFGGDGGLHLVDLDGDGNLDLVSGNDEFNHSPRTIEVRLGMGDGTFGTVHRIGTSEGAGQLAFGDLDNDGRIDVGFNGSSRQEAVATYLGKREGLSGVLATDINGDGRTDILAINHDNSHVKRLVNDGRGNFSRLHDLLVGAGPVDLISGDFNGNGRTDFLTVNRSGRSISIMLANGLGGYARTDVPVGRLPVDGALGKVTGGEHDDLLVIDAQLNALIILRQDGSGGFAESALIPLGDKPSSIAVGNVDGDGKVDVIISLAETNRLMLLRAVGSGQFADPTYVNLPAKPGKIAAGDLNGDGLLDIAVTFPETGEVALLFGMGQNRFTQPQRIRVGSQPDSIVIADANGDGRPDILVTNAGDNTASVILNRFDPNQLYRYNALAVDPDDDPVTYSILEGPGGMIVNSQTGEIRWAPAGDQVGTQRVVLQANDGRGGRTTQEFSIAVEQARTNAAPVITTLAPDRISAESSFTHNISATDPDGDRLRYRLVEGPAGASIDPVTGKINWDPRTPALQSSRQYERGWAEVFHTDSQNVESLTMEGWFKFASNQWQAPIFKGANWAAQPFYSLRYFNGFLQALIGDGTFAGLETLSVAYSAKIDQWVHLAVTFNAATGELSLLENGTIIASKTTTKRIGIAAANIPILLGNDVYPFTGDMYGLRFWNTARTPTEIAANMHRQFDSGTDNLFADFRFAESDSMTILDHSGNGNRGILKGLLPTRIVGMAPLQTARFTVSAEDGKGGIDLQTFSVTVAPKFTGSIEGKLFSDDNRDGSRQAGEALLSGWTVFVDHNGNGYRDAGEAFSITDSEGNYRLNGLLQGDFTVAVEPRAGYVAPASRRVNIVTLQTTASDIPAQPLAAGQLRGRLTQASTQQPLAHQQVFADLNSNALWDVGEPETTSDSQGRYALGGLAAGSYSLRMVAQPGWQVTEPASKVHDIVLASNDLLDNLDFVVSPSSSIAATIPQIVTQPPRSAVAGQTYRYAVSAISRDGQPISYSLSLAPTGMAIDGRTGQIAWTPSGKQTGSHQVFVRAATDSSRVDLQSYIIEVAPANSAPVVTSSPVSPASVGRVWSYPVMAQDAEHSVLRYALSVAPDGASIDADSGRITWTPLATQTGAHAFTVIVSDSAGAHVNHSFTLDVISDTPSTLPFTVRPPRSDASLLTRYLSRVSGVDALGQPLTVELLAGPTGLTLNSSGFIEWSPAVAQIGSQSLTVRFSSPSGSTEERTYSIAVRQTTLNSTPQIQSAPASLFAVAGQLYSYDLAVSDADGDALSFELVVAPAGMSIHPQLGTLRWLPTLDQLGQTKVTVRVTDPQGGSDTQSFTLNARRFGGPPLIQSVPPTQAAVGIGYLYSVLAIDAENDPLTYSLIEAPAGMTIDSRTGELAWTPTADQLGQQSVFIAVADATGNRTTQGFAVEVSAGLPNRPPVISSQPHLFATVGEVYSITLQATDPEGSTVTYSLRRGPEGMTVNASTGQVSWTPAIGQAGRAVVSLVATDSQGGASVQSFEIDVLGVNTPPEITSRPPAFAWAGGLFQYDIIARDVDRDPIRYEFVGNVPSGMTIDPLGRIRWQTQATDVGSYSIVVRASDPRGGQVTQQIDFEVRADNVPPKVTVLPRGGGWPWDGPVVVLVSAVDNVGVVDVGLRVNGQLVPLDANRMARLSFDDWGPGVLNMVATARDAAGNEATGTGSSFYRDPEVDYESGEGLPVATITSPSEDSTVTGMVRIMGTAIGGTAAATSFKEYRLSYARAVQLQFTEFVRSTTPVTDGLLGVWDTTLLENDAYIVRLEVVSEAGNTSVYETSVGLSGNLKLGNFRLSFEDLTIPVAGIPITIVRTYDTLRADRDGDFGYGWRLEYRNTDLRVSLPKSGLEDIGIYTPFRSGTKIYMTLPGGQRVGWTFTPEFRVLPGFSRSDNLIMALPRYTPDRGNTATLSAGSGWLTVNQFGELYATGGLPWNPASPDFGGGFTVTTADGIRYFIDGATGLMQTATDRNGNTLTFSNSGITSSLGDVGISIVRDRHDRISSITDPAGNTIRYGYSAIGDLIRITDREGHQTTMTYRTDRAHFLDTVIDPLGRSSIRSEYDDNGRLLSQTNAQGKEFQFSYSSENFLFTTYDTLGNPTVNEYDEFGNVVAQTDPLGRTIRFVFNERGQIIRSQDPLGAFTTYDYDNQGRLILQTNPMGDTYRFVYNSFGQLVAETDPNGNTTHRDYDAKGNLIVSRKPDGIVSEYTIDERGLVREVKRNGQTINTYDRDASGRIVRATDSLGSDISAEYDALGNVIREVREFDGRTERWHYSYDKNGNIASGSGPDGRSQFLTTNALNNITSISDNFGNTQSIQYSSLGEIVSITGTDGRRSEVVRDDMGRIIRAELPNGIAVDHEYDAAGQLIRTVRAGGSVVDSTYDAAGREISSNATGPRLQYEYDANGRVSSITNERGERHSYQYDAKGNLIKIVDALGGTVHYSYDSADRLVSTTDPLGRAATKVYDINGNLTEVTELWGERWNYRHDAAGRRIAAIDSAGNRSSFGYDGHGRLTEVIDPAGRTTRFSYTDQGQLAERRYPSGVKESWSYDDRGRLSAHTHGDDAVTRFFYDSTDRISRIDFPDSSREFHYSESGFLSSVSENGRTTSTGFNELGWLTHFSSPHTTATSFDYSQIGQALRISTNLNGNQFTSVKTYDPISYGLMENRDPWGNITTYSLDASGLPTEIQIAGDVRVIRQLDAIGRESKVVYYNSLDQEILKIEYTYDHNGRISIVRRGSVVVNYDYDELGQLRREVIRSNGIERSIDYRYDSTGNLLRKIYSDGRVDSFSVDENDALRSFNNQVVQYDERGNLIRVQENGSVKTYQYDYRNRLIRATRTGSQPYDVQYTYDVDGLLASRRAGDIHELYVWDRSAVLAQLLEVRNEQGELIKRFENDGQLIRYATSATGERIHYLLDQHGTPQATVQADGSVTFFTGADAFGNGATVTNYIGFTNGLTDPLTGMVFLRSRWFSPELSRFLTRDSADIVTHDAQSINRYSYVQNDPVNKVDPTGQFEFTILGFTVTGAMIVGAHVLGVATFTVGAGVSLARGGSFSALRQVYRYLRTYETGNGWGIGAIREIFGFEYLTFTRRGAGGLYAFIGGAVGPSIALDPIYGIVAYDAPRPVNYTGFSWAFTIGFLASFAYGVHTEEERFAPLMLGTTLSFSPTPTFWSDGRGTFKSQATPGYEARHAHTINGQPVIGFSIAVAYYFLIAEVHDYWSQTRILPNFFFGRRSQLGTFILG